VPENVKDDFSPNRAHPIQHKYSDLAKRKNPHFWSKSMRPANSPDLSPTENLWSILGMKLDEQKSSPTSISALEKCLTKLGKRYPRRSSKI
jgi:hypothetical protein